MGYDGRAGSDADGTARSRGCESECAPAVHGRNDATDGSSLPFTRDSANVSNEDAVSKKKSERGSGASGVVNGEASSFATITFTFMCSCEVDVPHSSRSEGPRARSF